MGGSDSLKDELLLVVYMRCMDGVPLDSTLQELVKIDRKDLEASRVQGAQDEMQDVFPRSSRVQDLARHHFSAACSRSLWASSIRYSTTCIINLQGVPFTNTSPTFTAFSLELRSRRTSQRELCRATWRTLPQLQLRTSLLQLRRTRARSRSLPPQRRSR
jgi:hypothetical protein